MAATSQDGSAHILALAGMISTAAQQIVDIYSKAGYNPLSLDSTEVGPFDVPENIPPELGKAIGIIEAASAQLSFTVAHPGHVITNKVYAYEEPACMLVVTEAKIADFLFGKSEGVHIKELSKKSGLDAGKLGRILRMLATKHCFREVKPDFFANNRLSMQLISTNPVSGLVGHLADECMKACSFLNDTLTDPKFATSTSANETPFYKSHGVSLFDFYSNKNKHNDRFAKAMVGWGEVTGKAMISKVYPWQQVPHDTVVCDVGGGNGHVTLGLVKEFPKLKVVLQDLPTVITQGKDLWNREHPEAVQNQRVEFIAMNFFKECPLQGCDYYYLRHVLHDWPDSECITILSNIHKAMIPKSRLLVHEFVLRHVVRNSTNVVDEAPEPLLPNFGMARVRLYQQDINMMTILNSKERTLQEFINFGGQSGFKFEKLWETGEAGLIEFSVA